MKITVIKKAEAKKSAESVCPWIVEDMATTKR